MAADFAGQLEVRQRELEDIRKRRAEERSSRSEGGGSVAKRRDGVERAVHQRGHRSKKGNKNKTVKRTRSPEEGEEGPATTMSPSGAKHTVWEQPRR